MESGLKSVPSFQRVIVQKGEESLYRVRTWQALPQPGDLGQASVASLGDSMSL